MRVRVAAALMCVFALVQLVALPRVRFTSALVGVAAVLLMLLPVGIGVGVWRLSRQWRDTAMWYCVVVAGFSIYDLVTLDTSRLVLASALGVAVAYFRLIANAATAGAILWILTRPEIKMLYPARPGRPRKPQVEATEASPSPPTPAARGGTSKTLMWVVVGAVVLVVIYSVVLAAGHR